MLVSDALRRIEIANNFAEGVHDPRQVLNSTGLYFFAMRPWRFTKRMNGYASSVAGVDYMTLPLGLTRLLSIALDDTDGTHLRSRIRLVDAHTFNLYRATYDGAETEDYLATEDWHADTNGTLTRRLALSRPAVETLPRGYRIAYEVGWPNIDAGCASSETLPLPNYVEPLFGELLEAYTLGLEEPQGGSPSRRCAEIVTGPIAAAAFEADARAVPSVGPTNNPWIQREERDSDCGFSSTITLTT